MNEPKPCCRDFADSTRTASPFDVVIALGFYDGPTEGWARCGGCGREFRFQMLIDQDPGTTEEEADIRIFGLSGLPEGSIERFSGAMGPYQTFDGPFRLPIWSFPSEEIRERMDRLVDEIDSRAGAVEFVIASSGWMDGETLGARSIGPSEIIEGRDWASILGLHEVEARG